MIERNLEVGDLVLMKSISDTYYFGLVVETGLADKNPYSCQIKWMFKKTLGIFFSAKNNLNVDGSTSYSGGYYTHYQALEYKREYEQYSRIDKQKKF